MKKEIFINQDRYLAKKLAYGFGINVRIENAILEVKAYTGKEFICVKDGVEYHFNDKDFETVYITESKE